MHEPSLQRRDGRISVAMVTRDLAFNLRRALGLVGGTFVAITQDARFYAERAPVMVATSIRESPARAVGGAIGVGFVVGFVARRFTRRARRREVRRHGRA